MVSANDSISEQNEVTIRRALQTSLAKLLDTHDYIIGQITALKSIEQQVRLLALRESSRCLIDRADAEELEYLRHLQDETNTNFRQIHENYAALNDQISKLMMQHEWLYDSTFAQGGSTPAY